MTREEATKCLKTMQHWIPDWDDREDGLSYWDAIDMALSALHPVSREQVEKVWKSEWIDNGERDSNGVPKPFAISCKRCGSSAGTKWMRFCPFCGAPMTDEAVQMVMDRLEEMRNDSL